MGGSTTSMSSMLGDGSVQLRLIGDDLPKMQEAAKDIAANMEELDSVSEADSGMGATSPEIKVTVDRAKAAAKGLTVAQVFQQVAAAVAEEKTSVTLRGEDGKNIDVVIVKDDSNKTTSDTVGSIDLTYTDSEGKEKKTSLSSVADIDEAETLDMIRRTDQKRNLIISGTVADGYSLTAATNDVRSMMDSYDLPAGCTVEYDGSDKMTMEAMQQLSLMLLLGVVMNGRLPRTSRHGLRRQRNLDDRLRNALRHHCQQRHSSRRLHQRPAARRQGKGRGDRRGRQDAYAPDIHYGFDYGSRLVGNGSRHRNGR